MAHKTAATPKNSLSLPVLVSTPVDLGRIIRELELLDDEFLQLKIQKNHNKPVPKSGRLLEQTAQLNKLDLSDAAARKTLQEFLVRLKRDSPVLHISFSADPNVAFIEKLTAWLRQEIHPLVLITIGLQPNIGAGCVLRSTNKYFDFSLRKDFESKRDLLLGALGAAEVTAARKSSPQGAIA